MRDLDEFVGQSTAFPDGVRGDWEAVLADAKRRRACRFGPVAGLALAVVAAAALALLWPFGGGRPGSVLDRALAAAGDGPVVHLVIREGWGGTLVDLASGDRTRIYGEREIWYDPSRGLHEVSRLGGASSGDALYKSGAVPPFEEKEVRSLALDYRASLQSGRARLLGAGDLDGIPVYWIRVHTEHHIDVADNKLHEWAHDIAISRDDYRPVGLRETLDRKDSPDGPSRILDYETLPAGSGDFTRDPIPGVDTDGKVAFRFGPAGPLTQAEAVTVLPVSWAGPKLGGLPLAGITKLEWAERPMGANEWRNQTDGVRLAYGTGDPVRIAYGTGDPAWSPLPGGGIFDDDHPYVLIDEFPVAAHVQAPGLGGYDPPDNHVFLVGLHGQLSLGGVAVSVNATSERLVLEAARALEPMPSR